MINKGIKNNWLGWSDGKVIGLLLICVYSLFRLAQAQEVNDIVLINGLTDGITLPAYTSLDIVGKAPAGRTLDVKLVQDQTTITMARVLVNSDGNWQVTLPVQAPNGPYKLTRSDGELFKAVHDVYIGQADYTARNPKADIILSTRLYDDMVLKPGEVIQINGLGEPGRTVDLKLLKEQQTITLARVETGPDGQWQVTMPGQGAGGPFELSVSDGRQRKMLKGIIIGRADIKQPPPAPSDIVAQNSSSHDSIEAAEAIEDIDASEAAIDVAIVTDTAASESKPLPSESAEQQSIPTHIQKEYLQPQFDVSKWTLVDLPSLEALTNNDTIVARKTVHFAIDPQVISLSLGQANQIEQIMINGHVLDPQSWKKNPLQIKVPAGIFQSGDNTIALLSVNQWDNTRFIGSIGRFKMTIDQFTLELSNNWRVFYPESELRGHL
jgi:hypothetical protein